MASIKCAHCKGTHESVEQVKLCARNQGAFGRDHDGHTLPRRYAPATPEITAARQQSDSAFWDTVNRLRKIVEAGYYAIELDGITKFYRIDKPEYGRWKGYTFVKVQASDDFYPVKGAVLRNVLGAIVADVDAARALYARELGRCYICGRTLTDELSRELGIGPVCREKRGM